MCYTWVYEGVKAKQPAPQLKTGKSHNELSQLSELGINRADLLMFWKLFLLRSHYSALDAAPMSSGVNSRVNYSLGKGLSTAFQRDQTFFFIINGNNNNSNHHHKKKKIFSIFYLYPQFLSSQVTHLPREYH